MPTHVKKIRRLSVTGLILLIGSLGLSAQQSSSSPSASSSDSSSSTTNQPQPAGSGASATGAPDAGSSAALDYLFNRKPQEGSVAKEGMDANAEAKNRALTQDAMGDQTIEDPEMRARFERYLGMNEVPQDQIKGYADDMNTVIDLLHQRRTTDAWQKLYKLAQYKSIDAGVSWELANRIESIWNANQTKEQIAQQNTQLKDQADTANYNADMMSDDVKEKEIEYQRRMASEGGKPASSNNSGGGSNSSGNGGANPAGSVGDATGTTMNPPSDEILGKLQLTEEYLNSLQAQAKIKLNDLKVEKLLDQAKSDFADYISTLYNSGRYQLVLIAADFWRQIFDEGDYPVSMAQQVNASLEINGEVNTAIDVFNNNLAQNNVSAATDNLEQAFMLNDLNPTILGVPLAKKKPILTFTRQLARMQNMMEARDYTDLEPLLDQIKQTAPDFDSVKALAMVNAVKLESQLDLGKAKLAAQQGDMKTAMEEFQDAGEVWPGNPDLKDKALSFFNSQDLQTQALEEFDRLVGDNNYWGIADKQLVFAPAMKDDPKRQQQLKDALGKVSVAETALEKAKLMEANGDFDGAWETIQLTIKDLPDDIKLNSMRGDLAGKAAEFVAAISKAQDAESKQELGYSLSWYAVAQRAYPASQMAGEAVPRLSKAILANASL